MGDLFSSFNPQTTVIFSFAGNWIACLSAVFIIPQGIWLIKGQLEKSFTLIIEALRIELKAVFGSLIVPGAIFPKRSWNYRLMKKGSFPMCIAMYTTKNLVLSHYICFLGMLCEAFQMRLFFSLQPVDIWRVFCCQLALSVGFTELMFWKCMGWLFIIAYTVERTSVWTEPILCTKRLKFSMLFYYKKASAHSIP